MAEDDDAKCSADVVEGAYIMAGVMAILGLMTAVLVLSGLFHAVLRRVGQPSIISHILVRALGMLSNQLAIDSPRYCMRRPAWWSARRCSVAWSTSGSWA